MGFACGKSGKRDSCPDSKQLMISTFVSSVNTGIHLDQGQINTTKRKISLSITNVFKLSGHFNENIYHKTKTVKVVQFVYKAIAHKYAITPVRSLKTG